MITSEYAITQGIQLIKRKLVPNGDFFKNVIICIMQNLKMCDVLKSKNKALLNKIRYLEDKLKEEKAKNPVRAFKDLADAMKGIGIPIKPEIRPIKDITGFPPPLEKKDFEEVWDEKYVEKPEKYDWGLGTLRKFDLGPGKIKLGDRMLKTTGDTVTINPCKEIKLEPIGKPEFFSCI